VVADVSGAVDAAITGAAVAVVPVASPGAVLAEASAAGAVVAVDVSVDVVVWSVFFAQAESSRAAQSAAAPARRSGLVMAASSDEASVNSSSRGRFGHAARRR
jgi:hypothetical protein